MADTTTTHGILLLRDVCAGGPIRRDKPPPPRSGLGHLRKRSASAPDGKIPRGPLDAEQRSRGGLLSFGTSASRGPASNNRPDRAATSRGWIRSTRCSYLPTPNAGGRRRILSPRSSRRRARAIREAAERRHGPPLLQVDARNKARKKVGGESLARLLVPGRPAPRRSRTLLTLHPQCVRPMSQLGRPRRGRAPNDRAIDPIFAGTKAAQGASTIVDART